MVPPVIQQVDTIGVQLPEVSRFFGIAIRFYYNDHEPAHFHAVYGEQEALIEIASLAVLRGELPRRALAHWILEWASLHHSDLRANWENARLGVYDPNRAVRLRVGGTSQWHWFVSPSAKPLSGFHVEITLTTGEIVERDLRPLLNGPVFASVRTDEAQFRLVRAENGSLVWPGAPISARMS